MWWRTVLVFSLLAIIENKAQIDNNGTDTQPKLCCPCPPGWPNTDVPHTRVLDVAEPTTAPTAEPSVDGVGAVDDCPCRPRNADSEGASSVFFPNAVRAFGNVVNPEKKEEAKPLLHPEVDLASSVLETLREATDEEYRDALERDAARAAATDMMTHDTDVVPEEATKVIKIVVSPRDMESPDDVMSEASHVQETRCVHSPLGNPRASFNYRSPVHQKGLEEILNLPLPNGLLHRQRDSNWAASNVHESIAKADNSLNNFLSGLKLRTDPGLFKLPSNKVDVINRFNKDGHNSNSAVEETNTRMLSETDSDSAPSNIQRECLNPVSKEENTAINDDILNQSKSIQPTSNIKTESEVPFLLKNLIKLRDVELIPLDFNKKIMNPKLDIPNIKFKSLKNDNPRTLNSSKLPRLSDLLNKSSKQQNEGRQSDLDINNELNEVKKTGETDNIQIIPRKKLVTTEILDALPSPSELNQEVSVNDDCLSLKSNAAEPADIMVGAEEKSLDYMSTEVIDDENLITTDLRNIGSMELKSSEGSLHQNDDDHEQIISQEDVDLSSSSVDLSQIGESKVMENHPPLKTLQEIRKSVVDKLDALHKSSLNALGTVNESVNELSDETDAIELVNEDPQAVDEDVNFSEVGLPSKIASPTNNFEEEFKDASVSSEEISFDDLQNMSDSILIASENQEQNIEVNSLAPQQNDVNVLQTAVTVDKSNDENSESEIMEASESENSFEINEDSQTSRKDLEPKNDNKFSEISCPTDLSKQLATNKMKASVSGTDKNDKIVNDLESGASEPVINSILLPNSKSLIEHLNDLESKLRQNIIVQPMPLINTDNLNIFRAPALLPDLSELNNNIPTLEEIRARVSEILGGLARDANDEDISSELDSDDFASNVNPVLSTEGKSSHAMLQPINPLEDINLDIVQLKPLPLIPGRTPLLSKLPGLNLNTYKAKLAVPKSLNLQPLKLSSTLGNHGGLVGATLSIEPNERTKSKISKGRSKVTSNLIKSGRGSLNDYSTLADITATLQKNANNLLHITNPTKEQTLQASNVIENIAKNLKSHTENTLRNVHQTLNPSPLDVVHTNLQKAADNLLSSGRGALENLQATAPINDVIDNLRERTEHTMRNLHETLRSNTDDLNNKIQKSTQNLVKLPLSSNSRNAALDNFKAQSDNVFKSVPQTLTGPSLTDLHNSIQKTAQNVLKSSGLPSEPDLLRSTKQHLASVGEIVDNLQYQTENAVNNLHKTLNVPSLSNIHTSIQKNAQQVPLQNTNANLLRSNLQQSTPLDKVVDNLKSQTQNTMRNIQQSLSSPDLADVTATVQKHAQNLLDLPKSRGSLEQILQASPPIDIKQHAEKAVKDLRKTLKTTLRNSPIPELQQLPDPKHVIEMISNHQEDVNDKLFALHTDLTDRLESIHNEVMDPEKLRSILLPPVNSNFELFSIPLPKSRMSESIFKKETRPVLKSGQLSFGKQSGKSAVPKVSKSKAQKLSSQQARIPTAASVPIPTRVDKPSLPLTSRKLILPTPLQKDSSIKPLILQPRTHKGINKPFLPKYETISEKNIKSTFGPTTQRSIPDPPIYKTKKVISTTLKPKIPNKKRFKPKPPVRQPTPWNGEARTAPKLHRISDPLTSPSRIVPVSPTPLKTNPLIPIKKEKVLRVDPLPSRLKTPSINLTKPKASSNVAPTEGRTSNNDKQLMRSGIPKASILERLNEALKNKEKIRSSPSARTNLGVTMTPSASAPVEKVVALEEPMKENISYKCRMMCVKLD